MRGGALALLNHPARQHPFIHIDVFEQNSTENPGNLPAELFSQKNTAYSAIARPHTARQRWHGATTWFATNDVKVALGYNGLVRSRCEPMRP
jgi:hypothetical protein